MPRLAGLGFQIGFQQPLCPVLGAGDVYKRQLCFPGLFKGALSVRARDINNEMKLAAAYAIADLITDADRSEEMCIRDRYECLL